MNDLRMLGRLSQGASIPTRRRRRRRMTVRRSGSALVAARRPAIPRWVVVAVVVVLVALFYLGATASRQAIPSIAFVPAAPRAEAAAAPGAIVTGMGVDVPPRPIPGSADRSARSTAAGPAFADVDGLSLSLPHAEPVLVAFHEASRPEALPMDPVGTLVANDSPTKFSPGEDVPGADYVVLSSRGRARPATSAVDAVVPEGAFATAPVSGRVVEVRQYVLYGRVRDWRVVIEPADRHDLHVVLIHLHRPSVSVGDVVEAGATRLAAVRLLPFPSHVDYRLDARLPHLHVEVKPALDAAPLDPNEPAAPADAEHAAG